ncbi:IS4 family transposase [Arcicella aquatica]|uniref:IS4 family transposase n=1 Tax=Arcicella aquatica TaxID=217141 RepID=A0ABU5QWN0_9BACT|nr:IS4 family transposase [Arcicella aquatica]MEA5261064.1 IS4 family transposase [Arcicella aquatica]
MGDYRLNKRLSKLCTQFMIGDASMPLMLCNRGATKAYYRFINNKKVQNDDLVAIFRSYSDDLVADCKVILAPQDTTELDYTTNRSSANLGCMEYANRKGMYLHNQLLMNQQGVVLGIFSQDFHSRSAESLGQGLKRKYANIADKESYRWLSNFMKLQEHFASQSDKTIYSISDREGDVSELLCAQRYEHIHYIIRSCNNRQSADNQGTLLDVLQRQPADFCYEQELIDRQGHKRMARLWVRYSPFVSNAPYRKNGAKLSARVWVIETKEENPPQGQEPISWRLLCSQAVEDAQTARKMIGYYAHRWGIERFHYVLKQGRKIEDLQIEHEEALKKAIILQSWIALKVCTLCYDIRSNPEESIAKVGFDKQDYELAYQYLTVIKNNKIIKQAAPKLIDFARLIAMIGGSLLQKNRPLGCVTLWRGFQKFQTIKEIYNINTYG